MLFRVKAMSQETVMTELSEPKQFFTVVFEGRLRDIANPFKIENPFGKVVAAGMGDALNRQDVFEDLMVAADAYKRAKSADPKALADAISSTNITDNVSTGPGISFNAKGQNDKLKNSVIQNRGGKLVTVAPKGATNAKVEWPMKPYDKRA